MSGAPKPLPETAAQFTSVQEYFNTCKGQIPDFDPTKVEVLNPVDADGLFELRYTHADGDQFCNANVYWASHEVEIRAGSHLQRVVKNQTFLSPATDSCELTNGLAGPEEMGGGPCDSTVMDKRLAGQEGKFQALDAFIKAANTRLQDHLKKNGIDTTETIDPTKLRILNEFNRDGIYSFLYESQAYNFFVEGIVDVGGSQMLNLRSGPLSDIATVPIDSTIEMNGACVMTKALLGKYEFQGKCHDYTAAERQREYLLSMGLQMFGAADIAITLLSTGKSLLYYALRSPHVWRRPLLFPMLRMSRSLLGFAYRGIGRGLATTLDYGVIGVSNYLSRAGLTTLPRFSPLAVGPFRSGAWLGGAVKWGWKGALLRGGIGAGLTLLLDFGFKWAIDSDYQSSVNQRVTDRIYDEEVYDLDWWDVLVVPLAVKGVRAGCRAIAPNAMNAAVTWDHDGTEADILAEDRKYSEDNTAAVKEVLLPLSTYGNGWDPKRTKELLQTPITLSDPERYAFEWMEQYGPEETMKYFELSETQMTEVMVKGALKNVQTVARDLVFIDQDLNDWAREFFNKDGTMKADQELNFVLQHWGVLDSATYKKISKSN